MKSLDELERQFLDSKSKIVFCCDQSLSRVLKAVKNCPRIANIVVVETANSKNASDQYPFGIHRFSNILRTPPARGIPKKDIDINRDIMILPYSSGTTGSPKGVMISHKNFGTMLNIVGDHVDNHVFKDFNINLTNENLILMLPFYHIYGFGNLMQIISRGATGVIMSHFDPDVFFRSIEKFKVNLF